MTVRTDRRSAGSRASAALIGAVTLLAVLVRLPGLGGDLWLDEIATLLTFVRQPLQEIVTSYQSANNHVLYSVLAHLSIGAFGESSWAVRLPALLFGVGTVPALYFLARAYASRGAAVGAALVLAVSYHHAYFSQNARGYTGLLFFSVLSTGLLARALATGRSAYWLGFAASAALNAYVLLSGVFVAVGQLLGVLVLDVPRGRDAAERRRRLVRAVGWGAVTGLLILMVHAPLLGQMFEFYTTADRDVGWTPSGNLVVILLRDALAAGSPGVALVGAVLLAPVVVVGLAWIVRRAPLVIFALALPPLIELGVAAGMGVGTYPRRFLLLLPFGVLVAVFGSREVATWLARRLARPAWAGPLFGVAIVTGMMAAAWGLTGLYRLPKQDYRGAIEYVEARRQPRDVLAGAYVADVGVRYYGRDTRSARTAEDLATMLAEGRPIWLVGTLEEEMRQRAPQLDTLVREHFEERARFPGLLGDGAVVVWRSRGAP